MRTEPFASDCDYNSRQIQTKQKRDREKEGILVVAKTRFSWLDILHSCDIAFTPQKTKNKLKQLISYPSSTIINDIAMWLDCVLFFSLPRFQMAKRKKSIKNNAKAKKKKKRSERNMLQPLPPACIHECVCVLCWLVGLEAIVLSSCMCVGCWYISTS